MYCILGSTTALGNHGHQREFFSLASCMMLPLETVTRAVDMAYLGMEDDLQTWRERGGTQQAEHTLNSGNFWRLQYCGYTGRFQV
jgi:hypothetical protein